MLVRGSDHLRLLVLLAGAVCWGEVLNGLQMAIICLRLGAGPSMRLVTRAVADSFDPSVLVGHISPSCSRCGNTRSAAGLSALSHALL